jgi:hypothetical protein
LRSVFGAAYDPSMLEHCERCQEHAPSWDHPAYADWYVGVSKSGDYLGVICTSCYVADGLSFIGIEGLASIVGSEGRSGNDAATWADARSPPSPSQPSAVRAA